MTIEERYGCTLECPRYQDKDCDICSRKFKIQGATEQKAIDEKEYTEEMRKLNEEWKENLEIQRKMLIDKAYEWFSEHMIEYTCYIEMEGWDIKYKEMHKDFRKAMEETFRKAQNKEE